MQKRKWITLGAGIALLLVLLIAVLSGDELKGTWDLDGTTTYQFHGNGKGEMILPGNTYSFRYELEKAEKKVSIDFEDEKAEDFSCFYNLDGEYLTLYGNVGRETFEYVFQK